MKAGEAEEKEGGVEVEEEEEEMKVEEEEGITL